MEPNHRRLQSLNITATMPRQTPRNDFGTVLAHAAHQVVSKGAGIVGGMIPQGPILSAAVSSTKMAISSVVPMGTTTSGGSTSAVSTSSAGASLGTPTGNGDAWDLLEAQKALSADGQKFNAAYLQLQNEMQRESREHNAISNIMKVRHDSAKAAINNIR